MGGEDQHLIAGARLPPSLMHHPASSAGLHTFSNSPQPVHARLICDERGRMYLPLALTCSVFFSLPILHNDLIGNPESVEQSDYFRCEEAVCTRNVQMGGEGSLYRGAKERPGVCRQVVQDWRCDDE